MGVGEPRPPSLPLRGLRGAGAPLRRPRVNSRCAPLIGVSVEIHSVFLPHAPCQPGASPASALTWVPPPAVQQSREGADRDGGRRSAVLLCRRSAAEEADDHGGVRRNRQEEGGPDQAAQIRRTSFLSTATSVSTACGETQAAFERRSIPPKQPVMKPTRRSRARRDGGRVAPPPVPSAPGSTRCWRPAPETAGDPSRLNRVAARRSSLRLGRNTPGIPPSRALSAGPPPGGLGLAGLGAHVGSTTGC